MRCRRRASLSPEKQNPHHFRRIAARDIRRPEEQQQLHRTGQVGAVSRLEHGRVRGLAGEHDGRDLARVPVDDQRLGNVLPRAPEQAVLKLLRCWRSNY
jgi:hypothetical protein